MQTRLAYMYRDASNYKQHGEAVFEGEITPEQKQVFTKACDSGEYFIASQVGLPDLQTRAIGFHDDTDDHVWSEFDGFELTEDSATCGSIHEFIRAIDGIEWDVTGAMVRLGLSLISV